MGKVTIGQQFHGTAVLAILQLRRLAKSNDIDAGFEAARALKMLDEDQERFMRECLRLDGELQHGADVAAAVTPDLVKRLQACIFSINSADPA